MNIKNKNLLAVSCMLLIVLHTARAEKKIKLTLGFGTPITGNQDIYKSNSQKWEQGDLIGTAMLSIKCIPSFDIDCSLWHHSVITDMKDVGVTGFSITKTWELF